MDDDPLLQELLDLDGEVGQLAVPLRPLAPPCAHRAADAARRMRARPWATRVWCSPQVGRGGTAGVAGGVRGSRQERREPQSSGTAQPSRPLPVLLPAAPQAPSSLTPPRSS